MQQALLFFCSLQQFVPMEADNWDCHVDPLSRTDASFQKYSLNTTQIHSSSVRTGVRLSLYKQDSQPTLPELIPSSSLLLDLDDQNQHRASKQICEIMRRFSTIQQMLLHHSEYESQLHERRRGLRTMPIDWSSLRGDYGNKMSIIGDIVELVEEIEREGSSEKKEQILDIKFQEYYLQRHYGAIVGENNTSFQDRMEEGNSQYVGSCLKNCQSIINCEEEDEEKEQRRIDVRVEVPNIIEIQIPILVYKIREIVVRQEESEVASNINNIDSIINRFSKPYEDIYKQNNTLNPNINSKNSNIIASIMIDSNHRPRQTQIQLIYSDFPEEHQFKLPLDSFAQIQSLISHDGSSTGNNSRPPTQRENYLLAINQQPIIINQKGATRSLLERIEENERILNEENLELKESVATLQLRVEELEKINSELQAYNQTLSHRLQEEIQQSQYFSSKLDEINAEVLEEKVTCLTHLASAKDRKIQSLTQDLSIKSDQLLQITKELAQLQKQYSASQDLLNQKDEEIDVLSKQIQEKEEELRQIQGYEENVIEIAFESEENMKKQIEKLEQEKQQLKQQLSQYSKRFKIQGISLQYQQAAQIQGIIENRQHNYSLQIIDLNKRYEEVIALYQDELAKLNNELEGVRKLSARVQEELSTKQKLMRRTKEKHSLYATQFEKIIEEYEHELQEKDNEILQLKKSSHFHSDIESLFNNFSSTVSNLQGELMKQKREKADIVKKILELDEIVRSQVSKHKQRDEDSQQRLIEELSLELEKKVRENKLLKSKLQENSQAISALLLKQTENSLAIGYKTENDNLRKVNQKLKRYCMVLQYQIKRVCGVDECQSHKIWVDNLIEQKNYFCSLLGGT